MIEKLIFLQHGGASTVGRVVPSDGGAVAGVVIITIIIVAMVGLWFLLTRKKGI